MTIFNSTMVEKEGHSVPTSNTSPSHPGQAETASNHENSEYWNLVSLNLSPSPPLQLDSSGSNHVGEYTNSKGTGGHSDLSLSINDGLAFEAEKLDDVSVPTGDLPSTTMFEELEVGNTNRQPEFLISDLVPESDLRSHKPEKFNPVPPEFFEGLPMNFQGSGNLFGAEEGCSIGDGRQLAVSVDPSSVNISQPLLRSASEGKEERDKRKAVSAEEKNNLSAQPSTQEKENEVTEQCESPASATLNEDECQVNQAPKKGMNFTSRDEAYEYYNRYAENNGFNVRKGKTQKRSDNTTTKQFFLCSREGHRREKKDGNTTRKKREVTRTGCKAHIQIALENEIWVVFNLCLEHNHECDLSPHKYKKVKLIGSKRSQKAEEQKDLSPQKYKQVKLIGSKRSQKAKEQKGNTPMNYSADTPMSPHPVPVAGNSTDANSAGIDSIFNNLKQVIGKSSQATSFTTENKKPNFSEERISNAKMVLKNCIPFMKIEDVFHSSHKLKFMEALKTLLCSAVLPQGQNSILEKFLSDFSNCMPLEKERSKVQKLFDSRDSLFDELKQLSSDNEIFKFRKDMIEGDILQHEEQFKEMRERLLQFEEQLKEERSTYDRISSTRKKMALLVLEKTSLLKKHDLEVPSWEKKMVEVDEAFKQVSSSWEDLKMNFGDL